MPLPRRIQQQRPWQQRLRAPVADVNRKHLQQRARGVVDWINRTLYNGGIAAKLRLTAGKGGRPTIVVLSPQSSEAMLTLPPVVGGFLIHVVL